MILLWAVESELALAGAGAEKRNGQRRMAGDLDDDTLSALARECKHDDFPVLGSVLVPTPAQIMTAQDTTRGDVHLNGECCNSSNQGSVTRTAAVCGASPAAPRIRNDLRLIFGLVTSVYSRDRTDRIVVNLSSLSRENRKILAVAMCELPSANRWSNRRR